MNKAEVKELYSMQDILARYGLHPNRRGFVQCPFHTGDREPSMKVYRDGYNCFACGANGDIFSFIMAIENQDFKEAFLSLGGTYENETFQDKIARYHAIKKQEMKRKQADTMKVRQKLNNELIDIYRNGYKKAVPFSEAWTDCYNALQYQLYLHEILNEPR
ncbi:MAG: DNA primase [Ruminococcus sp.]|nr:DNA primase [Ruminococcus sp.]